MLTKYQLNTIVIQYGLLITPVFALTANILFSFVYSIPAMYSQHKILHHKVVSWQMYAILLTLDVFTLIPTESVNTSVVCSYLMQV